MRALRFNWLGLGARRGRSGTVPVPLMASRDLPPVDPVTQLTLPRSPEPMPDEALLFAQGAARSAPEAAKPNDMIAPQAESAPLRIATGKDLRAMLERFEQASRRREALDQAAQARDRLVERLASGREKPALHLVGSEGAATRRPARPTAEDDRRVDQAMDEALASALVTLRHLSTLARN